MTTIDVEQIANETEADRVVRWRQSELQRAGYDEELAAKLAACRDVDLHRAVELLRQGCPLETAAQILL